MDLNSLRADIDAIDSEIVENIARRMDVCREVARIKSQTGIAMMQTGRVAQVKERCAAMGRERGLRPEFIHLVYDTIIGESCALEDRLMREWESAGSQTPAS
jgi:chorismate mutase-like protein